MEYGGLLVDSDNRMGLRYVIMSYVTVLLRLLPNWSSFLSLLSARFVQQSCAF